MNITKEQLPVYLLYIDVDQSCYYISIDEYRFDYSGVKVPVGFKLPPHVLEPNWLPIRDFVEAIEFKLVSQYAYDSIKEIVDGHAEFIGIGKLKGTEYYIMNVLSIIDCLDIDKSRIFTDSNGIVHSVNWAVFDLAKMQTCPIFKVPQDSNKIFVTQIFVDYIREKGISGVGFSDPSIPMLGYREPYFFDLPLLK